MFMQCKAISILKITLKCQLYVSFAPKRKVKRKKLFYALGWVFVSTGFFDLVKFKAACCFPEDQTAFNK